MYWLAIVVGLLATALSLVLLAYGPRFGYSVRAPTAAEDERLRQLRDDVGLSSAEASVRITSREGVVAVDLIGLPGRRTLVVTDAAFDHLDDEQLRALLAIEAERGRSRIDIVQALFAGLAFAILAAAYVSPLPFLAMLVAGWAIALVAIALVRRRYYAADAAAGELVGREVLRDAVERTAELRDDSLESGKTWRALLQDEPSVGARLERLGED